MAAELLKRGHAVTGIARNVNKVGVRDGLVVKAGDATAAPALAPLLAGHDAVVSASRFQTSDATALVDAVKKAGVKRLLVVGGSGSLEVLKDAPGFPPAFKPEASAGSEFLTALRREDVLDWTFLSPSAEFAPGERTGVFRLGGDQLLVDDKGKSWISMEDFAIAMVDELERPTHSRRRFTVGY